MGDPVTNTVIGTVIGSEAIQPISSIADSLSGNGGSGAPDMSAPRLADIVRVGGGSGESGAPELPTFPEINIPIPESVAPISLSQAARKARLRKFRPTAGRASTIATSPQGAIGSVRKRALIGASSKGGKTILGS